MKKIFLLLFIMASALHGEFVYAQEILPVPIPIPGGEGGVGFDDLKFSLSLNKVLVPGGNTGQLVLIDPATQAITSIGTLRLQKDYRGGHGEGITSADEGGGFLFTIDRTALTVNVINPEKETVVSSAPLASGPDYVRYVEPARELWVTEPDQERIEIFSFSQNAEPGPYHVGFIAVPGGPESLVIDHARQRAYTHLWKGKTAVIDTKTHKVVEQWPNGCSGSRGIAVDVDKGFLFAGCAEGKAVVLDVNTGEILGSLSTGAGIDVIGYNQKRSHLYLAGAASATLSILDISAEGVPKLLGMYDTVKGAHCAVGDHLGGIWVCDPDRGQVLLFKDQF